MEDEPDGQEMEYEVEQLETQVNEMEGTEDENCDNLLIDSNTAEDHDASYDGKYDDEIQWHDSAKEDMESLSEIRDLYISEELHISWFYGD